MTNKPLLITIGIIITITIPLLLFIISRLLLPSSLNPSPIVAPTATPLPNRPYLAPSIIPTPTPVVTTTNNADRSAIIAEMPISTPEYDIEYLSTSDSFIITIKQSPTETNRQLATEWFNERGVTNLTSFNVFITQYRYLE